MQQIPQFPGLYPVLAVPGADAALYVGMWSDCFPHLPDPGDHTGDLPLVHDPQLTVYGKSATAHRAIGFFSDVSEGYNFSGQTTPINPMTPAMREITTGINQYLANPIDPGRTAGIGTGYNAILVNLYRTGADSIGPHSDKEIHLAPSGVFAYSCGAVRQFRVLARNPGQQYYLGHNGSWVLHQATKADQVIVTVASSDRSVMLMWGAHFQSLFKHAVPVEKTITQPRISWTWRCHNK